MARFVFEKIVRITSILLCAGSGVEKTPLSSNGKSSRVPASEGAGNKFSSNLIKNDYVCINEIKKNLIV